MIESEPLNHQNNEPDSKPVDSVHQRAQELAADPDELVRTVGAKDLSRWHAAGLTDEEIHAMAAYLPKPTQFEE